MNKNAILMTNTSPHFDNDLIPMLINRIPQLGDFNYSDDVWYFNHKHKDSRAKLYYVVRFHNIDEPYKNLLKYYTLIKNSSIFLRQQRIYYFIEFINFLKTNYPDLHLENVNRQIINAFEYSITLDTSKKQNIKSALYGAVNDVFKTMKAFPEFPSVVPTKLINPFKQENSKNGDKLIPAHVVKKLDVIMKNMSIPMPLEFRTFYWLVRSFPNRSTEILSMNRDCLKTFFSEYTLSIPTFKQNGGYIQPEIKPIPVIYTGHGKFVIDLVKELQEQTKQLLENDTLPENGREEFLFIGRYYNFSDNNGCVDFKLNYRFKNIRNLTNIEMNRYLKELAKIVGLVDEDGLPYKVTSHQFRHNATTDRVYKVGYTMEQIVKLTGHKNVNMPLQYVHQLKEKHKEVHLNIGNLKSENPSPVSFKGRIMNLDDKTVNYLSKDMNKYLTWEVNGKKGVGICGDISGCNPKGTSTLFECYACEWFIPKADYYEDYSKEYQYWNDIIERIGDNPNRASQLENAIRNVSYLERILDICKSGISQYREQVADKYNKQFSLETGEKNE